MAVMWGLRQARPLWVAWQRQDEGICFWTLSFDSPEQEGGFSTSRKTTLTRQINMLATLAFLLLGVITLLDVSGPDSYSSEQELTRRVQLVGLATGASLIIALPLALQCRCLYQRVSVPMLEVALTALCCAGMCVSVLTQPLYLSKLLDHDLVHAYGPGVHNQTTDSMILLIIDGIVTATHLGLDIRWKVLFFTEVVGISLYTFIVFGVGSFEHNAKFNLVVLLGLVTAAAMAKRSAEITERKAFLDILKERTLRCQAEFQLSSREVRRETGPESVPESLPTTTATGRVFQSFYTCADVKQPLEEVEKMGINEHWHIDEREVGLLPDQVLGVGGFGMVVKGIFCGMHVAVKMSHRVTTSSDVSKVSDMCNELRTFRRLRHKNIVAMHGAIIDVTRLRVALVLELVKGMQLDRFVNMSPQCSSSEMPEAMAVYQIILGMCHALVYLHSRNPPIVHGDLKPSNIMVETSSSGTVCPRLLDFGLSCILTRTPKLLGGTLQWMAPEVCRRSSPARCSADIYSFANLVVFVATGKEPMSGLSRSQVVEYLRSRTPPMPVWPDGCPFEHTFRSPVARCLDVDAASRPSAREVHSEILQQLASLRLQGEGAAFLRDELMAAGWDQGSVDRRLAEANPSDVGAVVEQEAPDLAEARPMAAAQVLDALLPNDRVAMLLDRMCEEAPMDAGAAAEQEAAAEHEAAAEQAATREPEVLLPTSKSSMMLGLCEAMGRWNVAMTSGACCSLHEKAKVARDLCLVVLSSSCGSQSFRCPNGVQCPHCGVLGVELGKRCDMCEKSVGMPGRP